MTYKRSLRQPGAVRAYSVRTASRFPNAGKSLAKRRRWYADEDDTNTGDDDQPGADDPDDGESDESDSDDDVPSNVEELPAWAQKIISDARGGEAEYRRKLREAEEAQAEARRKEAEEQGKFKELYEELKAQKAKDDEELVQLREARTTRLEQVKVRNEKRIAELPKDKQKAAKDIIETAGTDDPDKVAALLDKIIPTLGVNPDAPDLNGGVKGDGRKQAGAAKVELNKVSY